METSIEQLSSVEFRFDLKAEADTLAPRIEQSLRKQRQSMTMKGFRPGRVPLSLVKRMYGKAVAMEVIDRLVQENFEQEVQQSKQYEILGTPRMTQLDYEPFGDLHAVIEFGVKPDFELVDLSETQVTRPIHLVADDEVETELQNVRRRHASRVTVEEPAGEDSVVLCDFQRLDLETDAPLVGDKQEGLAVYLGGERTLEELKTALTGRVAGDVVKVTLPAPEGTPESVPQDRRYEITVREITRQEIPEVDEEFARHMSNGSAQNEEELRAWIRGEMERQWTNLLRENFEANVRRVVTDKFDFPVPSGVVETYLDNFVEDLRKENKDELPEDFDEAEFRANNRESAEELVRWLLVRDKVVENYNLSVEPEEIDAEFEEMGKSRSIPGSTMRRAMEAYNPDGVPRIVRRLLDTKVYDWFIEHLDVVEEALGEDAVEAPEVPHSHDH